MLRRTKIVATLGPSSESTTEITKLINAGIDLVRLNFSHGNIEEHVARANLVRELSVKLGRSVAVLADMQGPKIRIKKFKNNSVTLQQGDSFILDATLDSNEGDATKVGLDYKELPQDCKVHDMLLLDDGKIKLQVKSTTNNKVTTEVITGGPLSNNKGINLQGGGISASTLTDKDKQDIKAAVQQLNADYIAISFVRCAEDLQQAKQLIAQAGGDAQVIAKIERAELVNDNNLLREVIEEADAIMVARGDLGVEIGDPELIGAQKHIINVARTLYKPVITATQMMESMIHNSQPTRAEVFDVANAVLDGTDAVMLSAETATGQGPSEVVTAMSNICIGAEKKTVEFMAERRFSMLDYSDQTIAQAALFAANHHADIKAIVCLTKSGLTPLWMSRINTKLPIFAVTRNEETRRLVTLYRGVHAVLVDFSHELSQYQGAEVIRQLLDNNFLTPGMKIILTSGDKQGTNCMQILQL
jgi:pyruvate kinase